MLADENEQRLFKHLGKSEVTAKVDVSCLSDDEQEPESGDSKRKSNQDQFDQFEQKVRSKIDHLNVAIMTAATENICGELYREAEGAGGDMKEIDELKLSIEKKWRVIEEIVPSAADMISVIFSDPPWNLQCPSFDEAWWGTRDY